MGTAVFQPGFQGSDSSEGADAAGGTSTAYQIDVGDRFEGNLSSASDSDWVEITLEAGESYVFSVWGTNGSSSGLSDPAMSLYDENGNQLEFNEDVFPAELNYFSMIEYTASSAGTYYISVDSFYSDSGDYILQATTDVLTVEQVATQLTEFGWGIPTVINHDEQTGDIMTVNLTALNADGEQLALWALEAWGEVMGMTFNTTTSTSADIVFDDSQGGAFAGPSSYNPNTGIINQATVNVGTQWLVNYGTTYDSYSFLTYLHEIGHALGLAHSGNYNGSATYGVDNFFQNDTDQMTVMSYFSAYEAGLGDSAISVTPMIADVFAIWGLYGEPAAVNVGNTVWGANSNVSGTLGTIMGYLFDGDAVDTDIYAGGPIAATITDTDGYDIIDLSTVSVAQLIDMREGGVSDIGGSVGNIVISLGTVIEEVIGGSGNDTVIGTINADVISGAAGNDILSGDDGADTIDGGDGVDTASYASSDARVEINLSTGVNTGGHAAGDVLDSIEVVIGSDLNDRLIGNAADNAFYGGDDADNITGYGGVDELNGGNGIDLISGGNGADVIDGGSSGDQLFGNGGEDSIFGGTGADTVFAGTNDDYVSGGDQSDTISGQSGADILFGDGENDTLRGGSGNDTIWGGDQDDQLFGNGNNDTLYGESGIDVLQGAAGSDHLFGGADNDTLTSGIGSDRLDGGSGDDVMNGGGADGARDTFVFMTGYDEDRINGFDQTGTDRLELDDALWLDTNPDIVTAQQMVDIFGLLNGTGTILTLDFGGGDILEIQNAGGIDATALGSDVLIV